MSWSANGDLIDARWLNDPTLGAQTRLISSTSDWVPQRTGPVPDGSAIVAAKACSWSFGGIRGRAGWQTVGRRAAALLSALGLVPDECDTVAVVRAPRLLARDRGPIEASGCTVLWSQSPRVPGLHDRQLLVGNGSGAPVRTALDAPHVVMDVEPPVPDVAMGRMASAWAALEARSLVRELDLLAADMALLDGDRDGSCVPESATCADAAALLPDLAGALGGDRAREDAERLASLAGPAGCALHDFLQKCSRSDATWAMRLKEAGLPAPDGADEAERLGAVCRCGRAVAPADDIAEVPGCGSTLARSVGRLGLLRERALPLLDAYEAGVAVEDIVGR